MDYTTKTFYWLFAWAIYIGCALRIGYLDANFTDIRYWFTACVVSLAMVLFTAVSFTEDK